MRWLYRPKPVNTLLMIASGELYSYRISQTSDISYPYIFKLMKKFERYGLITKTKQNRKNIISLTEKGKLLSEKLKLIVEGLK